MDKCDCYFQHGLKSVCYGTKEMEECSCGGDERKCNFYPEKRKPKIATEKHLIDANACPCIKCDRLGSCRPALCEAFVEWWFSPVDAVEVVRCKDCKYWKPGDSFGGDSLDDMQRIGGCPIVRFSRREKDFCCEGERRTDGKE